MHALTSLLTEEDKAAVSEELDRLFIFQDKPLTKEKKAALVEELVRLGIPVGALLQGIRSLMLEDMKTIKLWAIKEASLKFIQRGSERTERCEDCGRSGVIIMKDEEKREFALACRCPNGLRMNHSSKLTVWNGLETQRIRERTLELDRR